MDTQLTDPSLLPSLLSLAARSNAAAAAAITAAASATGGDVTDDVVTAIDLVGGVANEIPYKVSEKLGKGRRQYSRRFLYRQCRGKHCLHVDRGGSSKDAPSKDPEPTTTHRVPQVRGAATF